MKLAMPSLEDYADTNKINQKGKNTFTRFLTEKNLENIL
jgi:hypothetical protein